MARTHGVGRRADPETLSEDEMARVLAAEREFAEGKSTSGDEVFRKLGL